MVFNRSRRVSGPKVILQFWVVPPDFPGFSGQDTCDSTFVVRSNCPRSSAVGEVASLLA